MKKEAQAGLEYLMTYGWALILIATIIGALIFVISGPASTVVFTSSDPTKFLMKGGVIAGGMAEIRLQNVTGGKAEITKVTLSAQYQGCELNGRTIASGNEITPVIEVSAGGEVYIQCNAQSTDPGTISIEYNNYAGLLQTVGIRASGGSQTGGTTCSADGCNGTCPPGCTAVEDPDCGPSGCCGNNVQEGTEQCDGTDLAEETCGSKGYESGTLACQADCMAFDMSGCSNCGNETCDAGEDYLNCPADCCNTSCLGGCQNTTCNIGIETAAACPEDCCLSNCVDISTNKCSTSCAGQNGCVSVYPGCTTQTGGYFSCSPGYDQYLSCCSVGLVSCSSNQYCDMASKSCKDCGGEDGVCLNEMRCVSDPDCVPDLP